MNKGVDMLDFWKQRIETAQYERYSVYVCNSTQWGNIEVAHREIIKERIKPEAKVLDAACGYGRMSWHFDNYTGVDFSPDFIERAKKKYPGKNFLVADLHHLPFEKKSFDWAIGVSIKRMIRENLGPDAWIPMEKELLRVAKRILILEYENPQEYEIIR